MESVLSKSVGEQSKLHDEKYKLNISSEDSVVKLSEVGDRALEYLHKRGFHSSGKLRKHVDESQPIFNPTSDTSCADLSVIFDLYIKCMQEHTSFDDAGYSKSWTGVAKRLSEELNNCFVCDEQQNHLKTDTMSLQHYLEELSQILCSFGEYLPDNSMRIEYVEKLMSHVTQYAPCMYIMYYLLIVLLLINCFSVYICVYDCINVKFVCTSSVCGRI